MFVVVKVTVTTTGADGAATGSGTAEHTVNGELHAVYYDYHASAPATTDVTLAMAEAPSVTLLTVTDNATDGWYFPRQQVCGTTGTALTYDGSHAVAEPFAVAGKLTVGVAGANALTGCVTAYLYFRK